MKVVFGAGAIVATVLVCALLFYIQPSAAGATSLSDRQQSRKSTATSKGEYHESIETRSLTDDLQRHFDNQGLEPSLPELEETVVAERGSLPYVATAYSLRGRTASGRSVERGVIAADPIVLPLGTRVQIEAGGYTGEYLVADTGSLVRGRKIDVWMPSSREAMRFGKRTVKLTVLSYGPRRSATARRTPR